MNGARRAYRPRRRLRSELFPLVVALAVPTAILAVFPREAFRFQVRADAPVGACASCAFVRLSALQEAKALADARTSWQVDTDGGHRMRAELLTAELPDPVAEPVARREDRSRVVLPDLAPCSPTTAPRGLAAPPPEQIQPVAGAEAELAFPRAELLQLN